MSLRVVFFGSDPIALPLLNWLARCSEPQVKLVAVFTQPDRAVGRGQKIHPNAIKAWAEQHHLPVHQPTKLTEEVRLALASLQPDVSLVMAYGHILRQAFIDTPRLGTLNFHASLLPAYRGASPIQTSLACGETVTGVSLMRIVRELDAGPVADLERVPIGPADTAAEVEAKLALACPPLLARNLPSLANGQLVFTEQDHARATFCRRLVREDGSLDFSAPAATLAARIRGLYPWPACSVEIQGTPVKLGLATYTDEATPAPPGTVLDADSDSLRVATGQGILRLLRLQRPGGRMLPASEFLRGFPVTPGTVLPSTPMTPLRRSASA
jgi:methionyl-tRNA formyltransferase